MCGRQSMRGLLSHRLKQLAYLFLGESFLIGVFDCHCCSVQRCDFRFTTAWVCGR